MEPATTDEKAARIRTRASYLLFQELYEFLKGKPAVEDILRRFHDVLDAKRAFGSRQNAACAVESLDLVLRDSGMDDADIRPDEKHKKPCSFDCVGADDGNHT
jgi:hypothetical protein